MFSNQTVQKRPNWSDPEIQMRLNAIHLTEGGSALEHRRATSGDTLATLIRRADAAWQPVPRPDNQASQGGVVSVAGATKRLWEPSHLGDLMATIISRAT